MESVVLKKPIHLVRDYDMVRVVVNRIEYTTKSIVTIIKSVDISFVVSEDNKNIITSKELLMVSSIGVDNLYL